jgi:hypothetical protein
MNKRLQLCVIAFGASMMAATAASAGEIKGPPPTENYTADEIEINARSICVFSGLNDSPLGDPNVGDPGGRTQSFGSFYASAGAPVSEFDPRTESPSPGYNCNPNTGPDLHGGR